MAARAAHAQVEVVDVEPGAWCPACALPSGVTLTFAVTCAGRTVLTVARRCADCGGEV